MSGSLSDLFSYNGDSPVGPSPQSGGTLSDVLARLKGLYGGTIGAAQNYFTPGQPVGHLGLVTNPDGSVGTPGGGFNGPVKAPGAPLQAPPPVDPTVQQQGPLPTPPPPGLGPSAWPPQASVDPYRNAPSPASLPSVNTPGVASQEQIANAPAPPTPAQAQASAKDTSGNDYNTDVQAAQSQPAPKYNPNAHPADYSSASPPEDAGRALVVQNAAQKYGVPLQVANWVGFHESNWNNNVGTNAYGATGPWQFKRATADQYGLKDPNDFNASTDAAMHLLADNFKKTGNWADAVAAYGTFSTGKGADADAAARNGFLTYAQNANIPNMGAGVQVAGPGAPTSGANMAPQQKQQLSDLGIDPSQFQLPFDYQAAVQPSMSEKLYRMAAALQGNAGQAAGLMANDRQKMLEANNNALATQRLAQQLQYQNAGLDIRRQTADASTLRANTGVTNSQTAQQRLALAQQQLNPDVKARLAQAAAGGKDAAADINNTLSQAAIQANQQGLHDIDGALALNEKDAHLVGPTLSARWARFAAETGLTGDAADLGALQKMTTDQRNTAMQSLTNNHVGGIRSAAELSMLSKAFPDVGTSKEANDYILKVMKSQIQAKVAWSNELADRLNDPDQADSVTGQRLAVTRKQFYDHYYDEHPLPDYQGPGGQAPAPGTNASGSTKGAATLRWDQASQRMVPM